MALIDRYTEPYRQAVEQHYNHLLSYFPNEQLAEFTITLLIGSVYYWALGSLFLAIDLTKKPAFLYRYKIQKSSQISSSSLGKLYRQILFNQALQAMLGATLIALRYRYLEHSINRVVPTLSRFAVEFAVFNLLREVTFYYSHRWLHHPAVYRYVHKRHHEWQTPIALTAVYCHPLEHLLSNIVPVFIGPILMGSHNLASYIWIGYVITETISAHSGYQFPLNPISPVFHDFHHLKFNTNYGIFGVLDWLHGTDAIFRKSAYFKLHKTYFTFTPPADLRYDADKMK